MPALARTLTAFRELFSQLSPAPGLLLSLSEESRPLTREVTAVTLNDYLERLRQLLNN